MGSDDVLHSYTCYLHYQETRDQTSCISNLVISIMAKPTLEVYIVQPHRSNKSGSTIFIYLRIFLPCFPRMLKYHSGFDSPEQIWIYIHCVTTTKMGAFIRQTAWRVPLRQKDQNTQDRESWVQRSLRNHDSLFNIAFPPPLIKTENLSLYLRLRPYCREDSVESDI